MQTLNSEKIKYVGLSGAEVEPNVIEKFTSGHPEIDDFLHNYTNEYLCSGKGVTYILVESDEYESHDITFIYAFATISSGGLLQQLDSNLKKIEEIGNKGYAVNVPCAEIKYFAINQCFRGQKNITGNLYSEQFFKILLQDLYLMSVNTIGFSTIFLRANKNGIRLYSNCGFIDFNEYIIPFDEKADECTPMGVAICELDCW